MKISMKAVAGCFTVCFTVGCFIVGGVLAAIIITAMFDRGDIDLSMDNAYSFDDESELNSIT